MLKRTGGGGESVQQWLSVQPIEPKPHSHSPAPQGLPISNHGCFSMETLPRDMAKPFGHPLRFRLAAKEERGDGQADEEGAAEPLVNRHRQGIVKMVRERAGATRLVLCRRERLGPRVTVDVALSWQPTASCKEFVRKADLAENDLKLNTHWRLPRVCVVLFCRPLARSLTD